jgi:hypothetical protein
MKKILVLFAAMVMVLGFSAAAFAVTCVQCKCELRDIPCAEATQVGRTCYGFDYDVNLRTVDGYCATGPASNCRAVFPICDCAQAAWFLPGKNVGIQMTILVNGLSGDRGAYWSGDYGPGYTPRPTTFQFNDYLTSTLACAGTSVGNSLGTPIFYLADGTTAGATQTGSACTLDAGNKVVIMKGSVPYTLLAGDRPYWVVDIFPIRIDPAIVPAGAKISVKIEVYDFDAATPICPTCVGCLCDCVIDVAITCCAKTAPTSTLLFPYFADLKSTLGWWNGIVINNPTAAAGSCTLTAVENGGITSTATVVIPANGMYVNLLELMTFTGAGPGGVSARITAVCNYAGASGFAMMADKATSDSMGYTVGVPVPVPDK